MSLNVLKPIPITLDAQLLSTSATESTDPDYNSGTTYAKGATVKSNHVRYESLQDANTGNAPDAINSTWWLPLGPTNWWACFDNQISTSTTATGSLTISVKPGAMFNSVAVVGVSGAFTVQVDVYKGSGRTLADRVYTKVQTLDNTFISNWYQWLFEPYAVLTDLLFGAAASATLAGGFPPYYSAEAVVTITGNTISSDVSCSSILIGTAVELGTVQYGATAGINDYSVKSTDAFGVSTLVQRDYAKRATYSLTVDNDQIRRVHSTLVALRATPCMWSASDEYKFSPLSVFGYFKDFSINVAYPTFSTCSLEIEGMT